METCSSTFLNFVDRASYNDSWRAHRIIFVVLAKHEIAPWLWFLREPNHVEAIVGILIVLIFLWFYNCVHQFGTKRKCVYIESLFWIPWLLVWRSLFLLSRYFTTLYRLLSLYTLQRYMLGWVKTMKYLCLGKKRVWSVTEYCASCAFFIFWSPAVQLYLVVMRTKYSRNDVQTCYCYTRPFIQL